MFDHLKPALVAAAQTILDNWIQDEDGFDAEGCPGGVCQDIASAMIPVLDEAGIDVVAEVFTEYDGGHVFLMAWHEGAAWRVDIPPGIYETGAGYTWRKREGVILDADCVVAEPVRSISLEDFCEAYEIDHMDEEISPF